MNLQKIDTYLNADSVEFCPYQGLQQYLLCGTYKLEESTSSNSVHVRNMAKDHKWTETDEIFAPATMLKKYLPIFSSGE